MGEKAMEVNLIENGPVKIEGVESVTYGGQEIKVDGKAFLCRCGESSKAPFCDGSHSSTGFSDNCESDNSIPTKDWEGKTIRTRFNPNICMHVFRCKPLKDLREQELQGNAEAAQEIAKVVATCPSGALTFEMKPADGSATFDDVTKVEVVEGGEIRLGCSFESSTVQLKEGQPANRVTLCRCGMSKNKPFCDGRHKKRDGFK